jgi:outer membrane protein assembly factor BamB
MKRAAAIPGFGNLGRTGVYAATGLSFPVVAGDSLFLADGRNSGSTFVHDRHTGQLTHRLDDGQWCAAIDNVLLVGDLNDGVKAVDLPDLRLRWSSGGWQGWLKSEPAVSPAGVGYASLGFEGHHTHSGICAFNVSSGAEIFQVGDEQGAPCSLGEDSETQGDDDEGDEGPHDWVMFGQAHPVFAEGLVWMPVRREHDDDGAHIHPLPWTSAEAVGLDPATGERRWQFSLDPRKESEILGAIAVSDGKVLFWASEGGEPSDDEAEPNESAPASDAYVLHAIDIKTALPTWTVHLPGVPVGSPVIAGDFIYLVTTRGEVAAYDLRTGAQTWLLKLALQVARQSYDVGEEDTGAYYDEDRLALIPADGMLFVRTNAGITALRQVED